MQEEAAERHRQLQFIESVGRPRFGLGRRGEITPVIDKAGVLGLSQEEPAAGHHRHGLHLN